MRRSGAFALLLWLGAPVTGGAPEDATRSRIRIAVENYLHSAEGLRAFCFTRRVARAEFDSGGGRKAWAATTTKVDFESGVRISWLVARDDQPLPAPEAQRQENEARRAALEWRGKPEEERRSTEAKRNRKNRSEADFLKEMPDALNFRSGPVELRSGRLAQVFDFEPRPGYSPRSREAHVYEGVRGRIWIDQAEGQLVQLQAETFRDVTMGVFLASVNRGARFELQQIRHESGQWVPFDQLVRFNVRVLFKSMRRQVETQYRDFQRYSGPVWQGD